MLNDFGLAAAYYDRIFAARGKEYARESRVVEREIRERRPEAVTLLDVACGTALHLAHFSSAGFEASGLDRDREMLSLAKTRLPDVSFFEGDMRGFDLRRSFDAVVCMFGSIAYLESVEELGAACHTFRAHLPEGGVLVIEPFVTPAEYVVGDVAMVTIDEPGFKLSRMHVSERAGDFAVLDHHIQVADASGVRSFVERHRLFLFGEEAFADALGAARFRFERIDAPPFRQKLYVATAV